MTRVAAVITFRWFDIEDSSIRNWPALKSSNKHLSFLEGINVAVIFARLYMDLHIVTTQWKKLQTLVHKFLQYMYINRHTKCSYTCQCTYVKVYIW